MKATTNPANTYIINITLFGSYCYSRQLVPSAIAPYLFDVASAFSAQHFILYADIAFSTVLSGKAQVT